MSAEYNFTFDWDRISTLGKVKVLVEQVVSSGGGGGGGADSRVNLIVGSNIYPLISVTKTTVNGVSGVLWRYDDGSQDGLSEFIADGTGLNTVKTALEGKMPLYGTLTLGAQTIDAQEAVVSLSYADITQAVSDSRPVYIAGNNMVLEYTYTSSGQGHVFSGVYYNGSNAVAVTVNKPSSGNGYYRTVAIKQVQSTVTASDTNPVNSVAVIAYINSLDATNTLY